MTHEQMLRNAGYKPGQRIPQVGDRAYEVEWCTEIPKDEYGDFIFDAAVYHTRMVRTKGPAFSLATRMLPRDVIGEVSVTLMELTDPYGDNLPWEFLWEAVGDSEYVHA